MHVKLGDERAVGETHQGDEPVEGLGGDDHPRGVGGAVAQQPLESPSDREQPPVLLRLLGEFPQGRDPLQGLLKRHPKRDELGYPVGPFVGEPENPGHVPDHGPRRHSVEGGDLGDVIPAVALGHVAEDLVPTTDAEVDVEVGKAHPIGVEEPLEEEPELEGVDLGDPQGVGDQGPGGGAPARADGDPPPPGVAHEVGDDEEVGGEVHPGDDGQLVAEALLDLGREGVPVAGPGPGPGPLLEFLGWGPDGGVGGTSLCPSSSSSSHRSAISRVAARAWGTSRNFARISSSVRKW